MKSKIVTVLIIAIVLVGMILFANNDGYKNTNSCPLNTNCYCQQEFGDSYFWGMDNDSPLPHCIKGE